MPLPELTVYIVDDDASVRDSLSLMLGIGGYRCALYADAEAFLSAVQEDWRGCLVADLRLPGMGGVELQAELARRSLSLPVIIITAHGDVPTARKAFHARAVDFLEKPFDQGQLFKALDSAFAMEDRRMRSAQARQADADKLARLTAREREVLDHVARGLHAKEVATALNISPRTVEVHKTRIMAKLGARNVAEVVRFAMAGLVDEKDAPEKLPGR
jgi:FixJ family two-component response regulator